MKDAKARILVVEDDAALLSGLMDVLVFNGYDVKGVEDGGAGLRAGTDEQFDLILLDVMLPTMVFPFAKKSAGKNPPRASSSLRPKGPKMIS
jgi:two-component system response regulator RegX3